MSCKVAFLMLCLFICRYMVEAQDCKTYGQPCSNDFSCCGGCCLKEICRDKYLDCPTLPVEDPCINRYCPEDEVCVTYQPQGCKGCGPLPECRKVPIPEKLKKNKTLTHIHLLNSTGCVASHILFVSLCVLSGLIIWI